MRNTTFLFVVYLTAFAVRTIFAISLPERAIWVDESGYMNIALNVSEGKGFSNEGIEERKQAFSLGKNVNQKDAFYFAPGPVLPLVILEHIVGHHLKTLRIFHCAISSLITVFLFWAGILIFDSRKIAIISSSISAVYPYHIYLSPLFLPQNLFSIILIASLCFYIKWLKTGDLNWLMLTGLGYGLGCLFVVPTVFTFIPVVAYIALRTGFSKTTFRNVFVFMFFSMLLVAPYVAYATAKNDRFVMITNQGDRGLLKYNYPGITASDILSHSMDKEQSRKIESLYNDLKKNSGDGSVATTFLKKLLTEQPLFFLRNSALRFVALFSPITHTITQRSHSTFITNLIGITIYLPLLLLSIGGIALSTYKRNWIGLHLISQLIFFLIPYIMMIGSTRYRMPWDSIIILFASYSMLELLFYAQSRNIIKRK